MRTSISRTTILACSVLCLGIILLGATAQRAARAAQRQPQASPPLSVSGPTSFDAFLVQVIATSQWSPPSPDPAGVAYWPAHGTLLIVDSEVDEIPSLFTGDNVFETTLSGELVASYSVAGFSKEVTGVTVNPSNGHLFFSDDRKLRVFEVDLGDDGLFDTDDDVVTSFSTEAYGNIDPEGLAYGQGKLFVTDGIGKKIFVVNPGLNGIFDGVPPTGDDLVTSFDVAISGQPEGVAFDPDTESLYIISSKPGESIAVVTTNGTPIDQLDISFISTVAPAGVSCAGRCESEGIWSIYMSDRGLDNDSHPDENDGKLFKIFTSRFTTYLPIVAR